MAKLTKQELTAQLKAQKLELKVWHSILLAAEREVVKAKKNVDKAKKNVDKAANAVLKTEAQLTNIA